MCCRHKDMDTNPTDIGQGGWSFVNVWWPVACSVRSDAGWRKLMVNYLYDCIDNSGRPGHNSSSKLENLIVWGANAACCRRDNLPTRRVVGWREPTGGTPRILFITENTTFARTRRPQRCAELSQGGVVAVLSGQFCVHPWRMQLEYTEHILNVLLSTIYN